ncbi:MAG: hypothetical protein CVU12_01405 [Bacteroidetes bacterium HGW-Bacteroidetes-7]|jgi:hypothetical protein|nr:MAG: hypothetical protein CVU12_01405 [Bacteroidetes bacterium HGW-Bacteroidetes-7]
MKSGIITLAQLSSTGEPVYTGPVSSSILADNFTNYNTFSFNSISSNEIEVILPSKSDIFNKFGFSNVIKNIHILIPYDTEGSIVIKGVNEGIIVDANNTVLGKGDYGSIPLSASNYIILEYDSGSYTVKPTIKQNLKSQIDNTDLAAVTIESDESIYSSDDIITGSVPDNISSLQALFINKKQQGYYETRQRTDTYYSYSEWEYAGSPQPASFYFVWNEESQLEELHHIEVIVSWPEFVPNQFSVNYGVLATVEGAETNIAFEAVKGKIKATSGGVVSWDTDYIGQAYTAVIEDKIHLTNCFLFTSISASSVIVRLPSASIINAKTTLPVSFIIHITISHSTNNSIRLTSVVNGQIVNNNGSDVPYIDLSKCDSLMLNYTNGKYYILSILQ